MYSLFDRLRDLHVSLQWVTFYAGWFVLLLIFAWNAWHAHRLNALRARIVILEAHIEALQPTGVR